MPKFSKLFVFIFLTVLLSGCKIAAIVVEGGRLFPDNCEAGNICIYEVTHTNFEQQFVAVPESGWIFDRWQAGNRFLCGDLKQPKCFVSLRNLEDETAEKIAASSETAYLMPIFLRPRDIIEVDGKEWYQPYLFRDLSWNEINAICPDGICTGTLKGQDMTGWTWASVKDMNELFNYYIGSELLGPGPDGESASSDQVESNMFWDGWAPSLADTSVGYVREIEGWTKNGLNTVTNQAYITQWGEVDAGSYYYIGTRRQNKEKIWRGAGGWFYRLP